MDGCSLHQCHCPQFITIGPGSVSLETMARDVFDPQEMKLSRKPIGSQMDITNIGLHQIGANPCQETKTGMWSDGSDPLGIASSGHWSVEPECPGGSQWTPTKKPCMVLWLHNWQTRIRLQTWRNSYINLPQNPSTFAMESLSKQPYFPIIFLILMVLPMYRNIKHQAINQLILNDCRSTHKAETGRSPKLAVHRFHLVQPKYENQLHSIYIIMCAYI